MLAELFGALRERLDRANEEGGGERERIERLVRTVIAFSAERPELSRLIRLESASARRVVRGALPRAPRAAHASSSTRRSRARKRTASMRRLDHGFLYFALIGAATQLFAEPATARRGFAIEPFDETTADRYADFIVDVVLSGIWNHHLPRS